MAQNEKMEIDILANGKPAIKELDKVEKSTKSLEKTTVDSGEKMKASWIAIGAAIGVAAVAAKKAIDMAGEQVKAETALNSALKLQTDQTGLNTKNWLDYASALQAVLVFSPARILAESVTAG